VCVVGHRLGKNVRAQRRIITRMNYLNDKLEPMRAEQAEMYQTLSPAELELHDPIPFMRHEGSILKKLEQFQVRGHPVNSGCLPLDDGDKPGVNCLT
jgi:hypothetical protein